MGIGSCGSEALGRAASNRAWAHGIEPRTGTTLASTVQEDSSYASEQPTYGNVGSNVHLEVRSIACLVQRDEQGLLTYHSEKPFELSQVLGFFYGV